MHLRMKTKQISALLIFLTMSVCVIAQTPPENNPSSIKSEDVDLFRSSAYTGNVKIVQAGKIAELVGVRLAILKKQKGFEGYRIRIFAKTGAGARTEADDLRVKFRETYEHITPYLNYNSPNWEIHVGNYRNRMEAMEVLDKIKEDYPQAFVIKTIVEFPELETEEETSETAE
jgi:hypothetical protein